MPQQEAEASLNQHWDAVVQRYIDEQAFSAKKIVGQIVGGAAGVLIGLLLVASNALIFGILVLLLALAGASFFAYLKKQKCDKAVVDATAAREKAKAVSIDAYRGVSAEWVDAKIVYGEEDPKEADLLELVEGWPY